MAREAYTGVQEVEPQNIGPTFENVHATPEDFGSLQAQATQRLGATLETGAREVGQQAVAWQQLHNATQALNTTTAASQELGQLDTQYRQLSGLNAVNALPDYQKKVQAIQDKYAGQMSSPAGQLQFLRDYRSYADRALINMGNHAGDQAKTAWVDGLQASIKEEQSRIVRNTAVGEDPDFTGLITRTLTLAHERGLNDESAHALLQQTTGQAVHDMIVSRVAYGDTQGASAILSKALDAKVPGTDLPLLDAGHQASLSMALQQRESLEANRSLTDQMRALALKDKTDRDNAEKAGNSYVSQILKDPTQIDPAKIANDPSLKYEQKWSITNMLNAVLAGKGQGKDAQTYGPGFYSAYQDIHRPEGDPNRITDPFQLYGRVGANGDLTVAGVDKLASEIQGRRTPEGEAEGEMKRAFLSTARGEITGTNEGLHIRDPKGDEIYLKFLAHALPAYDAGKKAGKSSAQLLNPDSPDYVGKAISTFKRPMSQWTADMMRDNAPEPEGKGLDLTSQAGIISAYRIGKIGRDAASAALIKGGFATPTTPAPAAESAAPGP